MKSIPKFSAIRRSIAIFPKRDQKRIVFVTVIQILLGILDLVGVAIVGVLGALAVNGIQSKSAGNRVQHILQIVGLGATNLQTQVAILGVCSALILVLRTIASIVFTRRILYYLSRKSAEITSSLVSRLFSQDLLEIQSKTSQEVLYAILAGVNTISLGIIGTLVTLSTDLSLFILMSFGLVFVDPIMAFGTFVIFGVTALGLFQLMNKRALAIGIQAAEISVRSNEMILEVLGSYREAIVRNRRSYYVNEIQRDRFIMANNSAEISFFPYISKYVFESVVIIGGLLIAALQFLTQDASHAVAVLAVFMAAGSRIAPAVLRLQQGAIQIKSSIGSAIPTLDLIDQLDKYKYSQELVTECIFEYPGFNPSIEIRNLSFRYPESTSDTVKDVNLDIPSGSSIAFVGPSGAGKTTIVDLILGLLSPRSGTVSISNSKPSEVIRNYPGAISYVPQDVLIINGSIRQNVALGFPNALEKDREIESALRSAQLWDFVMTLPNGLDTIVGERGARISGGQRQRLGIARALFTRPKLLVLDEATSALDGQTESGISEAIKNLHGEVTVVLIAHRLSTVKDVNQIVYLENGTVLSKGSFSEVRAEVPEFRKQSEFLE